MNVGVLGSTGGGVFRAVEELMREVRPGAFDWCVVTDRACGLADRAAELDIPYALAPGTKAMTSMAAATFFTEQRVDVVLLYYVRLVTSELFEHLPTINFHPALLPAFPGLRALERTVAAGALEFGATTHLVDASLDAGPMIAQVRAPLAPAPFERVAHDSYVQKVYLALLVLDALSRSVLHVWPGGIPCWTQPAALAPDLAAAFALFERREQYGHALCP